MLLNAPEPIKICSGPKLKALPQKSCVSPNGPGEMSRPNSHITGAQKG